MRLRLFQGAGVGWQLLRELHRAVVEAGESTSARAVGGKRLTSVVNARDVMVFSDFRRINALRCRYHFNMRAIGGKLIMSLYSLMRTVRR